MLLLDLPLVGRGTDWHITARFASCGWRYGLACYCSICLLWVEVRIGILLLDLPLVGGGTNWHITARFDSRWVEVRIGILLLDLPLGGWR